MRLALDRTARRLDGGRLLVAGSPLTVFRLGAPGSRVVDAIVAGLDPGPAARPLVDRLLDTGAAHPRPAGGRFGPDDVTVVIPVRDHDPRPTLAAIGPVGAVVVVDDGSEQPVEATGATVLRHARSLGPGAARDTGAAAATAALLAFVDADCVPEPGWLDPLLAHFEDDRVALAAPRVESRAGPTGGTDPPDGTDRAGVRPPPGVLAGSRARTRYGTPRERRAAGGGTRAAGRGRRPDPGAGRGGGRPRPLAARVLARYEATRSPLDLGPVEGRIAPATRVAYVPAAALVVRRAAFEAVGGFDPALRVGEDVDLVWRLVEAGWRARYEPRSVVGHRPRSTLADFCRQRVAYGRSATELDRRHPGAPAPVLVSPVAAGGWALAALGHHVGGAMLGLSPAVALRRALPAVAGRDALTARLAVLGLVRTGEQLASAATRVWWPVTVTAALAVRPLRRSLVAAALIPIAVDWWRTVGAAPSRRLDPFRYVALRVLDDAAYGAGVWAGALQAGRAGAILPRFTGRPGRAGRTESAAARVRARARGLASRVRRAARPAPAPR